MSELKKRIITVGAICLLVIIGIGNHLSPRNDAGEMEPDKLTQPSYSSVNERIRIGKYGSGELGLIEVKYSSSHSID